jgi:hypothetical protein
VGRMDELKTLKDCKIIGTSELKQEARKWIEELDKAAVGDSEIDDAYLFGDETKKFIKHFFNLEDENEI